MATFSSRLKEAMEARNFKQRDLARMTGLDKSLISNYLKGTYQARQDNLHLLALALNVSEAWLMGYDVSPDRESSSNIDHKKEREFVHLFRLLTPSQQSLITSQIKGILSNQDDAESPDEVVRVYRAARSGDHHSGEIVEMTKKEWQEIKDAPETDELL